MNIGELFGTSAIGLLQLSAVGHVAHVLFALALVVILAFMQRAMRTQHQAVQQIADALLMQRRRAEIEQFRDAEKLEFALARILADGLGRNIQLTAGSLLGAVSPAPYLAVTDSSGVRIFVTQQPRLFRRLGIARRIQLSANLTAGSPSRRATMQAIWDAACTRHSLPQAVLPFNADWHALTTHVAKAAKAKKKEPR